MSKTEESSSPKKLHCEAVYFFSKFWWGLYIGMAMLMSVVLLIVVLFPLAISVRSDFVFGVLVLISGLLTDLVFRKTMNRRMLISEKLRYSILCAWIPLSLYVMLARPFE